MPPGGMPSFGGSMPFGDNGPPPFGDAMFSPGPDRGSTPSFDRGSQRYEFKQSPAYSPPSYSCEGQGSRDVGSSNGDGMFNQRMMGDVRCPPNGIKGHISPSDCLQTTVETTQIGFIKNSNGAIRMNSMSDTQSWTSPVDNESLSHRYRNWNLFLKHFDFALSEVLPRLASLPPSLCSLPLWSFIFSSSARHARVLSVSLSRERKPFLPSPFAPSQSLPLA